MNFDDTADMSREQLREIDRARRRYAAQLADHPDPRDPDHPETDHDEETE